MGLFFVLHLLVRKITLPFEQSHFDESFHYPNDLCQRDADIRDCAQLRPVFEEAPAAPDLVCRVNRSFDVRVLGEFVPDRQGLLDNVIRHFVVG